MFEKLKEPWINIKRIYKLRRIVKLIKLQRCGIEKVEKEKEYEEAQNLVKNQKEKLDELLGDMEKVKNEYQKLDVLKKEKEKQGQEMLDKIYNEKNPEKKKQYIEEAKEILSKDMEEIKEKTQVLDKTKVMEKFQTSNMNFKDPKRAEEILKEYHKLKEKLDNKK